MTGLAEAPVPTGLPHLPGPDDRDSVLERRCSGCGCWNHSAESRCQRCGRKVESSLGAEGRRELEETESLPGPMVETAPTPKKAAVPEWREELNRRLAGYRERKAAFEETSDIRTATPERPAKLPIEPRADKPSLPPRGEAVISPLPPARPRSQALPPARPEPADRRDRPPIVDRMLAPRAEMRVRQARPPVEELLAPIRYRFIAGVLDMGVTALALGVFLGVMHLTNPEVLAGPDRLTIVAGGFVSLLVIYWVVYLRLMGSTAGMHWTGLRVMNLDAQPPDVQQRWMRALGTVLSGAALGMGFLWSLFDEQHFTWHDRVSKTFIGIDN